LLAALANIATIKIIRNDIIKLKIVFIIF